MDGLTDRQTYRVIKMLHNHFVMATGEEVANTVATQYHIMCYLKPHLKDGSTDGMVY